MSNKKLILPLSIATMLILSPLVACSTGSRSIGSRTETWEGTRDFSVDACVGGIIGSWESYYERADEIASMLGESLDSDSRYDPSNARQEAREACDEYGGMSFTSFDSCHSTAENEIRSVFEEVLDNVETAVTASQVLPGLFGNQNPTDNFDIDTFRSAVNALIQLSIDLSRGLCNAGLSREGDRSEQLPGRYERLPGWVQRR